ncbi:VOC family protein [Angustibacter sp. McL0619]|uniref:VOC family protein n=1 Tax=Angustibacter sp. McL0619 TaxID=3415676 RepID=UPI003CE6B32B
MTQQATHSFPAHGQLGYLQLPAKDIATSARFYQQVLRWSVGSDNGGFEAPGLIGQLTTDLSPSPDGPVIWVCIQDLAHTLQLVAEHGGSVRGRPQLDGGERWLVEVEDPAGNRVGLVAEAPRARPQTMLAVRDVEAASRWYQDLLGLVSDHGGPEYERLLSDGELVLQLHQVDVEHHHGLISDAASPVGNGVLIWFGEVSDFDGVVDRAQTLGARVVRDVHRNPPEGNGNGPAHRELWIQDLDGYVVVVASPDGEAFEG